MQTETIVNLFIPFTVMMIMFAMGLTLRIRDFTLMMRAPKAVLVGCMSQLILLPTLGFIFAYWLAATPEQAIGLVLVASCPGGPSSNLMTKLAGGDVALSVSLTAISGVVTMLSIPLISALSTHTFAAHLPGLSMPILETALRLLLMMGLPLLLGMRLLNARAKLASRLEPIMVRMSTSLMVILIIGAVVKSRHELAQYGWSEVMPPMLLNITGIIIGILISLTVQLTPQQRVAIPLEVGAQNAALAIGLALTVFHSRTAAFPGVVYGTFMYLPCGLVIWGGRRYLQRLNRST
jgi:bile acid:Na+ symporter, BASS family